jgi:serine/threonine protein phosphatase PrpC
MTARLTVSARSDIGRVRANNEDAFVVADLVQGTPRFEQGVARFEVGPRGALLAVSDGMGGHKAGEVASAMTLAQLQEALATRTSTTDPDARIERATAQANAEVYRAGQRPSLDRMGATVTAVLIDGESAHVAQVGDSRAYLIRNGRLERLTRDQSFAEAAIRAGALSASEAAESPLANLLIQAIGQTPHVEVAISVVSLRQRDCLLLCSDGLTKEMGDDELRDVVLSAPSLSAACDTLVQQANRRGGHDNITVLLAGVNGDMPLPELGEPVNSVEARGT